MILTRFDTGKDRCKNSLTFQDLLNRNLPVRVIKGSFAQLLGSLKIQQKDKALQDLEDSWRVLVVDYKLRLYKVVKTSDNLTCRSPLTIQAFSSRIPQTQTPQLKIQFNNPCGSPHLQTLPWKKLLISNFWPKIMLVSCCKSTHFLKYWLAEETSIIISVRALQVCSWTLSIWSPMGHRYLAILTGWSFVQTRIKWPKYRGGSIYGLAVRQGSTICAKSLGRQYSNSWQISHPYSESEKNSSTVIW